MNPPDGGMELTDDSDEADCDLARDGAGDKSLSELERVSERGNEG